jgi:ergothioneine biosynthesis protein EgtB
MASGLLHNEAETMTRDAVDSRPELTSEESSLGERFSRVRRETERLIEPLSAEDCVIQSMPDVSPTKWHLAHTSWFFETFVLLEAAPGYSRPREEYAFLFNSYYEGVGARYPRSQRGLLSRPSLEEVLTYRRRVDEATLGLLAGIEPDGHLARIIELGIHHEEQHQELILMDIKHVLSQTPLDPAYRKVPRSPSGAPPLLRWDAFAAGLAQVGHEGRGFAFDNEGPRHPAYVAAFEIGSRDVTIGEYLDFVKDGGYTRRELWLSDGFATATREAWTAPLYWRREGSGWSIFTLAGRRVLDAAEPVSHVSYYEADAFARWAGGRLPTEVEWEVAAREAPVRGNFLETGSFHPCPAPLDGPASGYFGDVWQWTASAYAPYPGYRAPAGALGEYNGKFMANQFVLRGGSCVTPRRHVRSTYRNFFYPHQRWQFAGIRLARDAAS